MTISADRNTPYRPSQLFSYPVAASTHLYAGQAVVLDASGNAEAASLATGKVAVGICQEEVNNTGSAGAKNVTVKIGCFKLANYGSITKTSIGDIVYFYDDVSVQASGSSASPAGVMRDIESDGVWVEIFGPAATSGTSFLVANNLSEGTPATMRSSLGLDTGDSPTFTGITATGDITASGGAGALTFSAASSSIVVPNNSATGLILGGSGLTNLITLDTRLTQQQVMITGTTAVTAFNVAVGTSLFAEAVTVTGVVYANGGIDRSTSAVLAIGATNASGVTITPATTITGDLTLNGGAGGLVMTAANSSILCLNNSATGLLIGSSGMTDLLVFQTSTGTEKVKVKGTTTQISFHVDVGTALFDEGVAISGALTERCATSVITNDYVVSTVAIDGGAVIQCATDGKKITLPAVAAANKGMKVTLQNTGTATACEVAAYIDANNYIKGTVMAVVAAATKGKGIVNTKASTKLGDYVTLMSDGSDTWWIVGGMGVWAEQA